MTYHIKGLTVGQLTQEQLKTIVLKLVAFYEFTFFDERDTEESLAFTFVLEYIAVDLGLINPDSGIDTAALMVELVGRIDECAKSELVSDWSNIARHLPWLNGSGGNDGKLSRPLFMQL